MATAPQEAEPRSARETYGTTVRRLAGAQKSNKGAPAYSRFVNRPLGRYLAAAGFHLGLTPNNITAISAAFSFCGIALIALVQPSWWLAVAVCLLLVIGYALDAADGQLARLRGGGSFSGEWLDHVVDCAKISALHLAVLISVHRFFGFRSDGWLLVPIGFTLVAAVTFFAIVLNDQLRRLHAASLRQQPSPVPSAAGSERPSLVRSLLVVPTDYGLLCVVFLLLGWTTGFFAVYAALFAANTAYLLLALVRWFRDMGRMTKPA